MMKTKLLLGILSFLLLFSCKKNKNDLTSWNINGKVEYIIESYFETLVVGDSIVSGERIEEVSLLVDAGKDEEFLAYEARVYFNKKGKITEMSINNPGNSSESNELNIKEIFNYNEADYLEERISYDFGSPISKTLYERDKEGRPIKISIYDTDNKVFESESFQYNGDKTTSVVQGQNLEMNKTVVYYPSENILETISTFENIYDRQVEKLNEYNKPLEISFYISKDELLRRETFAYDNFGNEIYWAVSYKGEPNAVYTYKYKYDKHNNWIEQLSFENGEPKVFTRREIKYY